MTVPESERLFSLKAARFAVFGVTIPNHKVQKKSFPSTHQSVKCAGFARIYARTNVIISAKHTPLTEINAFLAVVAPKAIAAVLKSSVRK